MSESFLMLKVWFWVLTYIFSTSHEAEWNGKVVFVSLTIHGGILDAQKTASIHWSNGGSSSTQSSGSQSISESEWGWVCAGIGECACLGQCEHVCVKMLAHVVGWDAGMQPFHCIWVGLQACLLLVRMGLWAKDFGANSFLDVTKVLYAPSSALPMKQHKSAGAMGCCCMKR